MSSPVQIEPSGHAIQVNEGESILDAGLRQGLALPYGCRGGFCGECHCKVVSGEVEYPNGKRPPGLTAEDEAAGVALMCQAQPRGAVTIEVKEVEALKEIPIRQMPTKVIEKRLLNREVIGLFLKLPDTARLQYLAGQYVEFVLKDGKRRAFSIANPPHADNLLEFHIRHIQGGRFTESLFGDLPQKTIIRIEGPKGSFFLRESSDRPILMLATGTGFGPIKAIIEHAIAEKCRRPIYLYWGARNREELYLDALAAQWDAEHANIHYRPVLSRAEPQECWEGRTGHVQDAVLADFDDLSEFELYACGHPRMVYSAKEMLAARGLKGENCFSDAFEWAKD